MMWIVFIVFMLIVACMVAIAVRILVAEAFSDPDWMCVVDWENPSVRDILEMENTEFTLGHNVEHHLEEYL